MPSKSTPTRGRARSSKLELRRIAAMDSSKSAFVHTESHLVPLLEQLRHREPIFHTEAFGRSRAEWERMTAPGYWEVGASGRRYSRQFILDWLEKHPPVDAASAGWQVCDNAPKVARTGHLPDDIYTASVRSRDAADDCLAECRGGMAHPLSSGNRRHRCRRRHLDRPPEA